MISAHQALRLGGALEGIRLRRHNSHSPFSSNGSSCFSQIPICPVSVSWLSRKLHGIEGHLRYCTTTQRAVPTLPWLLSSPHSSANESPAASSSTVT